MIKKLLATSIITVAAMAGANAAAITGFGAPSSNAALSGASVVDFSSTAVGTYSTLNLGGVTVSSGGSPVFITTDNLGGSYNTTGRNLQNEQNSNSTGVFEFSFSSLVSAFGFNFGASNEDWRLEAFDSASGLIESFTLTQTWFSNAGDYFGIAANGIASAKLTQLTNVNDAGIDWVLIDNLSYKAAGNSVPAPSVILLASLALAGLAYSRRSMR